MADINVKIIMEESGTKAKALDECQLLEKVHILQPQISDDDLAQLEADILASISVTGVKGNAENSYRTGNINITPANIGSYSKTEIDNVVGSANISDIGDGSVKGAIKKISDDLEIITGTLSAGDTSITFTDNNITADSIFDFYSSVYGVNPITVTVNVSAHTLTLTFKAQSIDMTVGYSLR